MSNESMNVANGFIQAFDDADWDRLAQLFAPDCVYDEVGSGRRIEGRQAIVVLNQGWKAAWPDCRGRVINAIDSDAGAMIEVFWDGTHTGPLATPQGEIPPTGRAFSQFPTCLVFAVNGGAIRGCRHYFDILSLLQAIGVSPVGAAA
jgi:steroid delta-isomerase-like uncharacterized protein